MTDRECAVCEEPMNDFDWERRHTLPSGLPCHEDCCPDDRCKDDAP